MMKLRSAGNGIRIWLTAMLLGSLLLPTMLLAQALESVLADLKGEVQWSSAGSSQWQVASANTVVHAGDRVRTSANSSVRLAHFEGSVTDLGDSTGVRIDALDQADGQNTVRLSQ